MLFISAFISALCSLEKHLKYITTDSSNKEVGKGTQVKIMFIIILECFMPFSFC